MMRRQPFMVAAVVVAFALPVIAEHVHRNASTSLPITVPYLVWLPLHAPHVGDLVEACPPLDAAREARARDYAIEGKCPGDVAPFLKLVAAEGGDRVTVTPRDVSVNGHALPNTTQILHDSKGRALVFRGYGTRTLRPGELWLYGTAPRSFDSRKFGPVPVSAVRYIAWAPITASPLPHLTR